ncbi:Lysophosphatidic acid phosphatase type 6 [Gonapodya sp. JEL0774]|nr:Lysophosphatidic acid phosphatase type 6 [Gonapodya sp. JEL0774]
MKVDTANRVRKQQNVQIVFRHGARTPTREIPYRWLPSDTFSRSCTLAPALHSRLLAQELANAAREGSAEENPIDKGTGTESKLVDAGSGGDGSEGIRTKTNPLIATRITGPYHPFHEGPLPIHSFFEERGGHPVGEHSPSFYKSSWAYRNIVQALDRLVTGTGTCDMGQLTDKGKLHVQSIGSLLRDRYISKLGFLPGRLDIPDLLHVQSSDSARVMESAQFLLSGLYCDVPYWTGLVDVGRGSDHAVAYKKDVT